MSNSYNYKGARPKDNLEINLEEQTLQLPEIATP